MCQLENTKKYRKFISITTAILQHTIQLFTMQNELCYVNRIKTKKNLFKHIQITNLFVKIDNLKENT